MHSVRIELAKLILVGTRITYQATGDAGSCLLSGNVNQNKGTQQGPTKIAKRYDMMVAISTNI